MPRRKQRIKLKCQKCGKGFEVYPSRVKQKLCCRKCPGPKVYWSSDIAYLCGLIASDGHLDSCVSRFGIASINRELIDHFQSIVPSISHIYFSSRKHDKTMKIYTSWNNFRDFLESIGITPRKSLTISSLDLPNGHFEDFLRGIIDGDGTVRVHKNCLEISIWSGSNEFLVWLARRIKELWNIEVRIREDTLGVEGAKARAIARKVWYLGCRCLGRKKPPVPNQLEFPV